jgi:hypothetical protein
MSASQSIFGIGNSPRSQRDTVPASFPTISANAACEKPSAIRSRRNFSGGGADIFRSAILKPRVYGVLHAVEKVHAFIRTAQVHQQLAAAVEVRVVKVMKLGEACDGRRDDTGADVRADLILRCGDGGRDELLRSVRFHESFLLTDNVGATPSLCQALPEAA